jgi:hypothetical protein
MNLQTFSFPAIVSSAIIFGSGCVVTAGIDPIPVNECFDDGAACGANADCCSGVCDGTNTCAPAPACMPDDGVCGGDADCCSGVCDGGTCAPPVCAPDGDACVADVDCCGADFCDNGACSICVSAGNACDFDSDCCSGICDGGTCTP